MDSVGGAIVNAPSNRTTLLNGRPGIDQMTTSDAPSVDGAVLAAPLSGIETAIAPLGLKFDPYSAFAAPTGRNCSTSARYTVTLASAWHGDVTVPNAVPLIALPLNVPARPWFAA